MQSSIGIVRIFLIDNTNVSIYSAFDALEGLQVLFVKPAARRHLLIQLQASTGFVTNVGSVVGVQTTVHTCTSSYLLLPFLF